MVKQSKKQRPEIPATVVAASEAKFKGVRKRKWGKYVSEVRLPNSRDRIWLGSFDSAEKAARAFDAALFLLRGRNAKFNFPDRLPNLVGGGDGPRLTHSEIQAAASEFANSDTVDSPSPSSCETTDSDLTTSLDGPLTDSPVVSWDDPIDFGMFPGIEDFPSEFLGIGIGIESTGVFPLDELLIEENPVLWSY